MARLPKLVELTESEKAQLISITKKGTHKSRKIIRARALLLMGAKKDKLEVMAEVGIDSNHYHRIKSRYFAAGIKNALEEKPRTGQPSKINEKLEAKITSIACSTPPEGRSRWTLSLINERLVELQWEEPLSKESVRKVLKKVNLNLG